MIMSADEDTELRDLVSKTLESKGVIDNIKAELRATVFLALENEGAFKDRIPLPNKQVKEFASTLEGKQILSLFHEFLDFFKLSFTMSVFKPETCNHIFNSREELCKIFSISNSDFDGPVISELLKQNKFDRLEENKSGHFNDPKDQADAKLPDTHLFKKGQAGVDEDILDARPSKKVQAGVDEDILDARPSKKVTFSPFVKDEEKEDSFISAGFNRTETKSKTHAECSFASEVLKRKSPIHDPFYDDDITPIPKPGIKTFEKEKAKRPEKPSGLFKPRTDFGQVKGSTPFHTEYGKKHQLADSNRERKLFEKDDSPMTSESARDVVNLNTFKNLPSLSTSLKSVSDAIARCSMKDESVVPLDSDSYEKQCQIELDLRKQFPFTFSYANKEVYSALCAEDIDVPENSEQSVEEELDEFSAGLEDLLNSISSGDETTNDTTVSKASAGGYDHLETSRNK